MAQAAYPELQLLQTEAQETSSLSPEGFCSCLALLPMGVACPPVLLRVPVVSYTTISPLPVLSGGMFLWPDPAGFPAPGVTRHRAQRSADFPQLQKWNCDRPADLDTIHDTIINTSRQFILRKYGYVIMTENNTQKRF